MKTQKEQLTRQELRETLARLHKAGVQCAISFRKCKAIGLKPEFTNEELEVFDAYTSRFARVSDIITQRVFRLIDMLEFEEPASFLDSVNRAEKRGVITSAFDFKQIRELRNEIAHEYALRDYNELANEIMRHTPILLDTIETLTSYCKKFED